MIIIIIILNTGITYETFQQYGKQDSVRHMLKSSISMFESSDSRFFRTTTGIQPDTSDKSRFVMTFLTILGVTEFLCSFRLVLEGKAGKEKPESSRLKFYRKFFSKQFRFIRCRRQHLRVVE